MSRPIGIHDKPELYTKITRLLMQHPEGMIAYQISQELHQNDCTVRKYLKELVEQSKILLEPLTPRTNLYKLPKKEQ